MTAIDPKPFELPANSDFASALAKHAAERPDAIATLEGERRVTWREQVERIRRVANALIDLGIAPGDRVAVIGRNSIEYADVFLGALLARACIVPLPTMASAESLVMMMNDSGSRVLIGARDYLEPLVPSLAGLERLLPGGCFGFDFEDARFS
ncbi:MAG TPA: AMP-binding protein, partial [Polyangiales bacterium]|nr:AMP-binding protein [Polyangiales bacterium]